MASPKTLNRQQQIFALEYAIDHNGKRAAIAAGYSVKNAEPQASRLLTNPLVAAEIARHEAEITKRLDAVKEKALAKLEITAEKVLQDIAETVERCKQSRPVLDKHGDPVMVETPDGRVAVAYRFEPMAVLKGCELLGKHFKLFVERIEERTLTDQVKRMTDDELDAKMLEAVSGA